MTAPLVDRLGRADAALAAGDREAAISELVAAWRGSRSPQLAQLVEDLSAIEPRGLAAQLATKYPEELDNAIGWWRSLVAENDPRVTTYLHGLVNAPPFAGSRFWTQIFALVTLADDPRSIEALAEWIPAIASPRQLAAIVHVRSQTSNRLRRRYARIPALEPDAAAIASAIRLRIDELSTATAAADRPGAELLAAIRAAPGDDRPRLVYADWLQERGDPRGEFIALQLANAGAGAGERDARAQRREQVLLRDHVRAWLGPIGDVAVLKRCRFVRGFPVEIAVGSRIGTRLAVVFEAAEWWSVEEILFGAPHSFALVCAQLVRSPAMTSLRIVRGLGSNLADQLANAQPPLPLTTLGFLVGAPLVLHGARPGLPDLQHLVLEHPPWTSCVTTFFELLGAPIATGLRSLALQTANLRYVLTADPRGRLTHLVIDAASATDRTLGGVALEDLSALLRDGPIATVELVVTAKQREWMEARFTPVIEGSPRRPPLAVTVR